MDFPFLKVVCCLPVMYIARVLSFDFLGAMGAAGAGLLFLGLFITRSDLARSWRGVCTVSSASTVRARRLVVNFPLPSTQAYPRKCESAPRKLQRKYQRKSRTALYSPSADAMKAGWVEQQCSFPARSSSPSPPFVPLPAHGDPGAPILTHHSAYRRPLPPLALPYPYLRFHAYIVAVEATKSLVGGNNGGSSPTPSYLAPAPCFFIHSCTFSSDTVLTASSASTPGIHLPRSVAKRKSSTVQLHLPLVPYLPPVLPLLSLLLHLCT